MSIGKQPQFGPVPVGLAGPGGFPWSRLVIGLIALVLSATVSWRATGPDPETARKEMPAEAAQQAGTASAGVQPIADLAQPPAALSQEPPLQVQHAPQTKPAGTLPAAPQLQRASTHVKSQSRHHSRGRTGATMVWAGHVARNKPGSSAVARRGEHRVSREEVAALTGEDSGSVYLSQLAARRQLAAANSGEHAQASPRGRRSSLHRS